MKTKLTFICMMFIVVAGTSFSQDKQDWKFMHPTPQNNILRKVKMVSENNWVTTGGNGTFMHTSNSGVNWYFQFFAGKVNAATLATQPSYDLWFLMKILGSLLVIRVILAELSMGELHLILPVPVWSLLTHETGPFGLQMQTPDI